MSVQSAIRERRSIRAFLDKPVDDDKLKLVLEAAWLISSCAVSGVVIHDVWFEVVR